MFNCIDNSKLRSPATLYLNDGSKFVGSSFGAAKDVDGEIGKSKFSILIKNVYLNESLLRFCLYLKLI